MNQLSKNYNPSEFEQKIYNLWEQSGDFKPDTSKSGNPYVVVIPPPNVTGSLHLGHALDNTLIDILIRYHRMLGEPTLYMPGTDHAGIATQNKVEKKLAKEGKRRYDLGREKFIEEVWKWKKEYGDTIINQLKAIGASCDWSKTRFTMDEQYSRAVEVAFKHYYDKGWIYQGERLINWCPRCSSAISDLEVNHINKKTALVYIKYPLTNKKGFITVATTRPETMLGDTAVAVNINDQKYKDYKDEFVNLPLQNRKIPIIFDKAVDKNFATGAVKVTPGHSQADWEIGKRHNLPVQKVIDEYGRITPAGGKFKGLKTFEAREKILKNLTNLGLIEKIEKIDHNLSVCDRCETPIEPLVSKQWFLKMNELIKPAIKAIENDEINFYPKSYKKITLSWMKNITDWCISRQIWWGHQLPVWYRSEESKNQIPTSKIEDIYSGSNPPDNFEQVTDVLDTWFSSALWPFATLGWPEKTEDLKLFYPTSVLLTAKDIIFLWVSRMIFSGLEFIGETPFKDVYIHATVLNKEGRRMSKSLGTGVDPLELINTYGADATRFGLVWQNMGLQQFKFSLEPTIAGKKFTNKIWNSSRYVLMNLTDHIDESSTARTDMDKQILDKLEKLKKNTHTNLSNYRFGQALHEIYDFFWHDFCDQYLEDSKKQLENKKTAQGTKKVLLEVLCSSLKLIHPFMPFVTEAIWQNLVQNNLVKEKRLIKAEISIKSLTMLK